jgi:protein SCO1/2
MDSRVPLRQLQPRGRIFAVGWLAILCLAGVVASVTAEAATTNYFVRGVLKEVKQDEHRLVITHESIPNFMDAMTMPFNVKDPAIFTKVAAGEQITFQLHVTETESWVDHIEQLDVARSTASPPSNLSKGDFNPEAQPGTAAAGRSGSPLRYYKFTNELGQPVSLSDFRGQAVALAFFYTRCPIPEFCPRLSRNFEEVQSQLSAMENAPTNWHLISVTFDPDRDTPEVLKAYGARFHYDSAHWSFLTGPKDKIAELARLCDVKFDSDNGLINHNFRTLIIDSSNRLQMVFPTSGDLSESIVQELLKAVGGTNHLAGSATGIVRSETVKP